MTKDEAITKVAKLHRLAKGNSSTEEAKNARAAAAKLMEAHGLTASDVNVVNQVAAFDSIVESIQLFVENQGSANPIIIETIKGLKTSASPAEKSNALKKIVTTVRLAALGPAFLVGEGPRKIKKSIDEILSKHDVIL